MEDIYTLLSFVAALLAFNIQRAASIVGGGASLALARATFYYIYKAWVYISLHFAISEIAKHGAVIRNQQEKQRKYDLFGIFFM